VDGATILCIPFCPLDGQLLECWAFILNAIAERAGYHWGGWVTFLLLGFFGACLLLIPVRIYIVRTRVPRQPDDW
jgi:hypothetical protein